MRNAKKNERARIQVKTSLRAGSAAGPNATAGSLDFVVKGNCTQDKEKSGALTQ